MWIATLKTMSVFEELLEINSIFKSCRHCFCCGLPNKRRLQNYFTIDDSLAARQLLWIAVHTYIPMFMSTILSLLSFTFGYTKAQPWQSKGSWCGEAHNKQQTFLIQPPSSTINLLRNPSNSKKHCETSHGTPRERGEPMKFSLQVLLEANTKYNR